MSYTGVLPSIAHQRFYKRTVLLVHSYTMFKVNYLCVAVLSTVFGAVAVSGNTCAAVDSNGAATFTADTQTIGAEVSNKYRPTFELCAGGAGRERPCSGADDRHRRGGTLAPPFVTRCSRPSLFPVFFLRRRFSSARHSRRW